MKRKSTLPKGTGTQGAAVRLLWWMLTDPMQQQCRDVREAAATEAATASVATLPVCPQVQVQQAVATEALAALTADVEGLASMGPPVCTQI